MRRTLPRNLCVAENAANDQAAVVSDRATQNLGCQLGRGDFGDFADDLRKRISAGRRPGLPTSAGVIEHGGASAEVDQLDREGRIGSITVELGQKIDGVDESLCGSELGDERQRVLRADRTYVPPRLPDGRDGTCVT